MYADGYELIEIVEENNLSSEAEVIEDIQAFKELSKVIRGTKRFTFNTTFKELIIDRYQSGFSTNVIANEIGLGRTTVSKYLKEAGINCSKVKNTPYEVIENWDDFDCCPKCNKTHTVRQLGLHNQDDTNDNKQKSAYCSSCYTEWYQEVIGTFQGEPVFETRKVVWHTVK